MDENINTLQTSELPLTQQSTPSTPKEKRSFHFPIKFLALGIVLIIILITIGASSYLLGSHSKSTSLVTPPTATPTPNPTANWKTYTDPLGRFTFQYPPSWTTLIISHSDNVLITTPEIAKKAQASLGYDGACHPFYPIQIFETNEVNGLGVTNNYQTTTISSVVIDGVQTKQFAIDYKQTPPCAQFMTGHEIDIPVNVHGSIYYFQLINDDNPDFKKVFDTLLTTFKFLSPSPTTNSPSPTPSQIIQNYTDKYFGYAISYPNTWIFRRTYGPDIQKQAPTDVISGFDISYNSPDTQQTQATIVMNMLDAHGLTDIQSWISQYDLNYPKNATKTTTFFNGHPAILYSNFTESNHPTEYIYFLSGKYAYRLQYWEQAGISQITKTIVASFQP